MLETAETASTSKNRCKSISLLQATTDTLQMESIHFPKPGRSVEAEGTTAWSAFAKKLSQMHRPEENATSTDAIALESLIAIRQLIMNGQDKEAHREAASMLEGSIFKAASPINRAGVLYIVGCLARYQGDLQRGQELLAKSEAELSQHWQELAESEDSAESRSDQDKQRARYRGMEMYDLLLGAREAATTGQTGQQPYSASKTAHNHASTGHRHADIAYYSTAEAPSGLRNERHHVSTLLATCLSHVLTSTRLPSQRSNFLARVYTKPVLSAL